MDGGTDEQTMLTLGLICDGKYDVCVRSFINVVLVSTYEWSNK